MVIALARSQGAELAGLRAELVGEVEALVAREAALRGAEAAQKDAALRLQLLEVQAQVSAKAEAEAEAARVTGDSEQLQLRTKVEMLGTENSMLRRQLELARQQQQQPKRPPPQQQQQQEALPPPPPPPVAQQQTILAQQLGVHAVHPSPPPHAEAVPSAALLASVPPACIQVGVRVWRGRGLKAMDSNGSSDPYCVLFLQVGGAPCPASLRPSLPPSLAPRRSHPAPPCLPCCSGRQADRQTDSQTDRQTACRLYHSHSHHSTLITLRSSLCTHGSALITHQDLTRPHQRQRIADGDRRTPRELPIASTPIASTGSERRSGRGEQPRPTCRHLHSECTLRAQ